MIAYITIVCILFLVFHFVELLKNLILLTEYTVLIAIKGIEFDAADLMVSTADG
jgi:hypothetical protein